MLRSVAEWNSEPAAAGEAPIEVGIGLHFGTAVLGDIGDEQRLEYAVIGDTVNVASRLEHDVVSWTRFDGAKRPFL